jgi:hypothetical protein
MNVIERPRTGEARQRPGHPILEHSVIRVLTFVTHGGSVAWLRSHPGDKAV